jgi:hypothetical protein
MGSAVASGSTAVSLSATSLNFGSQPFLVTSTAQTVTLTNTGTETVSISSIAITGTNADDFSQRNNCGSSVTQGGSCTISVTFFPTSTNPTGQFMTLSTDKTHLVNTFTNKPVFITGDAPQLLFVQLSDADVETYLQDRASRHFSALWVYPIDNYDQTNAPKDYYGNVPFDGPKNFTNEDATYWAHIDYVVQRIAAYGMTAFMNVAFVGDVGTSYYMSSILSSSDKVMTAYGAWIGNRYKDYPNIVWVIGGDAETTVSGLYEKLNDIAVGILSVDPNHLFTLEGCAESLCGYGNTTTYEDWTAANVGTTPVPMNLNWIYNEAQSVGNSCAASYASAPYPNLIGEDTYELEYSITELQLREELYQGVLSGCTLGQLFGNNAIWTMGGPRDTSGKTWQSQLGSQGSLNEEYNGQLMRSREFWKLVPDTNHAVLTGGIGSGTTLSVGSCTSDGQSCIVYDPIGDNQSPQIAMSHFSGAVHAWWFNPSTAATTDLGSFTNSGTQIFTPPDANDWVLVLDLGSADLPAPGSADLD